MKNQKMSVHSLLMFKKNIKDYKFVIIVMILSFCFVLNLLLYFDTTIYNENKETFSSPKELVTISNPDAQSIELLESKLKREEKTIYYNYYYQGAEKDGITYETFFVPNNIQQFYFDDTSSISLDKSENMISLKKNEIYVSKDFYDYLNQKNNADMHIDLPVDMKDSSQIVRRYYVRGWFEINQNQERDVYYLNYNEDFDEWEGRVAIMARQDSVPNETVEQENTITVIYSKKIKNVIDILSTLGIEYNSPLEWQENAKIIIRSAILSECIIIVVLYILLGINIRSIAINTLNKRKFEIGVRRAIGAKKTDIIMQFLIESGVVMILSLIFSVAITCFIGCIYKIYCFLKLKEVILIISPYSIMVFSIFVLFTSLYFSFSFAYQTTKVEVVQYLKQE